MKSTHVDRLTANMSEHDSAFQTRNIERRCLLSAQFQVREFALLAGVTKKAPRHYDRLGLFPPASMTFDELVVGNRNAALADERSAPHTTADICALMVEVESASRVVNRPAARA